MWSQCGEERARDVPLLASTSSTALRACRANPGALGLSFTEDSNLEVRSMEARSFVPESRPVRLVVLFPCVQLRIRLYVGICLRG